MCFSPRSGSNLIARHMSRTGVMGAPQEYFNYDAEMFSRITKLGASDLKDYVGKLTARRTSPNGVFAAKVLPGHWEMLRTSRCAQMIMQADLVVTTRKDVAAQAVSMHIAEKSGSWTSEIAPSANAAVVYDYDAILGSLRYIESVYAFWAATVSRRSRPAVLAVYEHFIDRPEKIIQMIARAFNIGLDPAAERLGIPILEKQATARNEDWAGRFREDMAARGDTLSPSPFAAHYAKLEMARAAETASSAPRS